MIFEFEKKLFGFIFFMFSYLFLGDFRNKFITNREPEKYKKIHLKFMAFISRSRDCYRNIFLVINFLLKRRTNKDLLKKDTTRRYLIKINMGIKPFVACEILDFSL